MGVWASTKPEGPIHQQNWLALSFQALIFGEFRFGHNNAIYPWYISGVYCKWIKGLIVIYILPRPPGAEKSETPESVYLQLNRGRLNCQFKMRLMEEILHQLDCLSHYLPGFTHPRCFQDFFHQQYDTGQAFSPTKSSTS